MVLTIGQPVKGPERRDPWWCPVRVGPPLNLFTSTAGEDALQSLVLALTYVQTVLPSIARTKGLELEWLGEFERLVLAETKMLNLAWSAVENLLDGLSLALGELDKSPRAPKALTDGLRALVASSGVSRNWKPVRKRD